VPTAAERIFIRLEQAFLFEPAGLTPTVDSAYSGGGFTLGARYRWMFFDDTSIALSGHYSMKAYKKFDLGLLSRGLAADRAKLSANVGWRDATQVGYYGLGIGTTADARANYRMQQTYATGTAEYLPVPWLKFGGTLAGDFFNIESGKGSAPSIEEEYDETTAPGFGTNPTYVHTEAAVRADWRRAPDYSRTGGTLGVALTRSTGLDDASSFTRLRADAIYHLPILRQTWVISTRVQTESLLGEDSVAPYFMMPALGGGHSLRAYSSFRFRDRNTALGSAEFRWIPSAFALDFALFADAGTVAGKFSELGSTALKTNWGFGTRFHGLRMTPLRIEIARGDEGWHLVFAGSAAF
jgi:hypothetical protein